MILPDDLTELESLLSAIREFEPELRKFSGFHDDAVRSTRRRERTFLEDAIHRGLAYKARKIETVVPDAKYL